jgi:uncharacterized protein (DUF1697 family)
MPTYISLLRGINVASHNRMKMEPLRSCLESLGFKQVRTYLQSGNLVFSGSTLPTQKLSENIEQQIHRDFGLSVPVISLTADELANVVENNPLLKQKGIDTSKLHVTFLAGSPQPQSLKRLDSLPAGTDQFRCSGRIIYLSCPGGYGETKLSNVALEKCLLVRATTRNWMTVNNLYQMASEKIGEN